MSRNIGDSWTHYSGSAVAVCESLSGGPFVLRWVAWADEKYGTTTGLHRGSLYEAFGSKRGLFLAALRHVITDGTDPVVASAPPGRPASHVRGATFDPGVHKEPKGIRKPGLAVPDKWAGTFSKRGEKSFWNVGNT